MDYITKKEFAERMGVTTVTVFNWIKIDKNGIRKYNSKRGILTSIFDDPAWNPSSPAESRGDAPNANALTAEISLLQAQLDGLKGILATKDEMITALQQRIAYMEGQLQQQMEVVNRLTLPAPRKTLGERFKAALGIKPKTP